jgi:H+/Cl- antiporter ClcA
LEATDVVVTLLSGGLGMVAKVVQLLDIAVAFLCVFVGFWAAIIQILGVIVCLCYPTANLLEALARRLRRTYEYFMAEYPNRLFFLGTILALLLSTCFLVYSHWSYRKHWSWRKDHEVEALMKELEKMRYRPPY